LLSREAFPSPVITLADKTDLFAFAYEDFQLQGYEAHPHIKAAVAI
jgi:thymidylate synthase